MKITSILLLFLSFFAYAQEDLDLIYVDLHNTNKESLRFEIDKVVNKQNSIFLLNINGQYKKTQGKVSKTGSVISDLLIYEESINDILIKNFRRPLLSDAIRSFTRYVAKNFRDHISIKEGLKKGKVNLHFFFDIETCQLYRYDKNLVKKLLLVYNLTNRDGIDNRCHIFYHINYEEPQYNSYSDAYLKEIQGENITIKTY